jgi:pimeloyl-ACP methyl ester carboxylesterase
LEEFFEHAGTFGFIASGRRFAILSFRGTQPGDLRDLLTDIDISLTTFGAGGRVHRGFLRALDDVWEAVDARVDALERRGYRLWYTGHSLGAALATLAAARHPPTALVTFGSPLVGDLAFGRTLGALQVHRVVNCCDIIPTVPPEAVGYRHIGKQYFLTARGRLLVDPPSRRVFRSKVQGTARYATKLPWLRPGMVSLRSLADHTIINYAAGLHRTVKQWRTPQDPSIRAPSSTGRMP